MRELEEATVPHDSKTGNTGRGEFEIVFHPCRRRKATSRPPNGLVVSSDDEVSRKLAESLWKSELAPLFASTVAETRIALARREVSVVLCNDCLTDGTYEDIVKLLLGSHAGIPLVVVSRTGEWPEYLRAIGHGAFDYVAYPPIRGDLQRAIINALAWSRENREGADAI